MVHVSGLVMRNFACRNSMIMLSCMRKLVDTRAHRLV